MTVLQNHLSRHLQMRVRFSRWDEILETKAPAEDLPYARAIWHYARGRALAARLDGAAAAVELDALRQLVQDPALADAAVEFNAAPDLLAIAADVLAAYVAVAAQDYATAVRRLRNAAAREDDLVYGEPPEWSVPVRHDLGEVLLRAGRAADAETAFREDLEKFPENGWSLDGLTRSLTAQGRGDDADAVRRRFEAAWSTADMPIGSARP
jgi:tetratricopeptide (TPR) repeat protein